MTRKDYEHVAEIISRLPQETVEAQQTALAFATHMAAYFAVDNPRFQRTRFLQACKPIPIWLHTLQRTPASTKRSTTHAVKSQRAQG